MTTVPVDPRATMWSRIASGRPRGRSTVRGVGTSAIGCLCFCAMVCSALCWAAHAGAGFGLADGVPSPAAPARHATTVLGAVTCIDEHRCVAVGGRKGRGTLVELWNGRSWRAVPSPNPRRARSAGLSGVSCPSRRFCVAVGSYTPRGQSNHHPLIERWDGRRWRPAAFPPKGIGAMGSILLGVSCTTSRFCLAVGEKTTSGDTDEPLAVAWHGRSWSISRAFSAATARTQGDLHAVSCAGPRRCMAVGSVVETRSQRVIAAVGMGAHWRVSTPPAPKPMFEWALTGLSCPSPRLCWTVGSPAVGRGLDVVLDRYRDRRWWRAPAPISPRLQATMEGLACGTRASCMAVGFMNPEVRPPSRAREYNVALRWGGSRWVRTSPWNPRRGSPALYAVACTRLSRCLAVGTNTPENGGGQLPIAEWWNGSRWLPANRGL